MNGLKKVLVVDSGERAPDSALSAELAGMGYASITTPFEAADDVLALIPSPVAVVLQIAEDAPAAERSKFLALAQRFQHMLGDSGVPVILLTGDNAHISPRLLQCEPGAFRIIETRAS
ncbi:hypothetical protein [Microvirga flavescens]|uniref:hypothetical protein n=1 Tax=Microvirga flavescens TaxID=2249811 RepID=UPI000DDA8065|nr:hypothetical protein [Microvirga flavescens]